MIVGVRAALICAKVDHKRRGNTYIDVLGDALLAESSPGLVSAWLALHLDLDDTATAGRVDVTAQHFEQQVQIFQTREGLAGIEFPLLVPVLTPGPLTVIVSNTGDAGPVARLNWSLGFVDNPKRLGAVAGQDLIQEARVHARIVRDGMLKTMPAPRRGRTVN